MDSISNANSINNSQIITNLVSSCNKIINIDSFLSLKKLLFNGIKYNDIENSKFNDYLVDYYIDCSNIPAFYNCINFSLDNSKYIHYSNFLTVNFKTIYICQDFNVNIKYKNKVFNRMLKSTTNNFINKSDLQNYIKSIDLYIKSMYSKKPNLENICPYFYCINTNTPVKNDLKKEFNYNRIECTLYYIFTLSYIHIIELLLILNNAITSINTNTNIKKLKLYSIINKLNHPKDLMQIINFLKVNVKNYNYTLEKINRIKINLACFLNNLKKFIKYRIKINLIKKNSNFYEKILEYLILFEVFILYFFNDEIISSLENINNKRITKFNLENIEMVKKINLIKPLLILIQNNKEIKLLNTILTKVIYRSKIIDVVYLFETSGINYDLSCNLIKQIYVTIPDKISYYIMNYKIRYKQLFVNNYTDYNSFLLYYEIHITLKIINKFLNLLKSNENSKMNDFKFLLKSIIKQLFLKNIENLNYNVIIYYFLFSKLFLNYDIRLNLSSTLIGINSRDYFITFENKSFNNYNKHIKSKSVKLKNNMKFLEIFINLFLIENININYVFKCNFNKLLTLKSIINSWIVLSIRVFYYKNCNSEKNFIVNGVIDLCKMFFANSDINFIISCIIHYFRHMFMFRENINAENLYIDNYNLNKDKFYENILTIKSIDYNYNLKTYTKNYEYKTRLAFKYVIENNIINNKLDEHLNSLITISIFYSTNNFITLSCVLEYISSDEFLDILLSEPINSNKNNINNIYSNIKSMLYFDLEENIDKNSLLTNEDKENIYKLDILISNYKKNINNIFVKSIINNILDNIEDIAINNIQSVYLFINFIVKLLCNSLKSLQSHDNSITQFITKLLINVLSLFFLDKKFKLDVNIYNRTLNLLQQVSSYIDNSLYYLNKEKNIINNNLAKNLEELKNLIYSIIKSCSKDMLIQSELKNKTDNFLINLTNIFNKYTMIKLSNSKLLETDIYKTLSNNNLHSIELYNFIIDINNELKNLESNKICIIMEIKLYESLTQFYFDNLIKINYNFNYFDIIQIGLFYLFDYNFKVLLTNNTDNSLYEDIFINIFKIYLEKVIKISIESNNKLVLNKLTLKNSKNKINKIANDNDNDIYSCENQLISKIIQLIDNIIKKYKNSLVKFNLNIKIYQIIYNNLITNYNNLDPMPLSGAIIIIANLIEHVGLSMHNQLPNLINFSCKYLINKNLDRNQIYVKRSLLLLIINIILFSNYNHYSYNNAKNIKRNIKILKENLELNNNDYIMLAYIDIFEDITKELYNEFFLLDNDFEKNYKNEVNLNVLNYNIIKDNLSDNLNNSQIYSNDNFIALGNKLNIKIEDIISTCKFNKT